MSEFPKFDFKPIEFKPIELPKFEPIELPKFEFKPIELPKFESIELPKFDWDEHKRRMAETDALLAATAASLAKSDEMLKNLPDYSYSYQPTTELATESKSIFAGIILTFIGFFS